MTSTGTSPTHAIGTDTSSTDRAAGPGPAVLRPGDDGYAAATTGFNLAQPHRPALVVLATGHPDVTAAVGMAATRRLSVVPMATGHGLRGDLSDALLVSTAAMDRVHVDPRARTASVGAGATWRQVVDATAAHGLAPLCGSSSQVGAVGYTLGGGLSPVGRRHGFAADHVRSLEVVTADARVRRVDAHRDGDLFWALRGGRDGLGIVTEMTIDLFAISTLHGGGMFYGASDIADVLQAWRTWAPGLPEESGTSIAVLRLPPDPALPEPLRGRTVAHVRFTHLGDADEVATLLAPMRQVAPPLVDTIGPMPFADLDAVHLDPVGPMPVHEGGTTLSDLPAEAVDRLLEHAGADVATVLAMVEIRLMGGALRRQPATPNAVTGREAAFSVFTLGVLVDPVAHLVPGAVDGLLDSLAPWDLGPLLNFAGDRGRTRRDDPLSGPLEQVRRRHDPTGMFRRADRARSTPRS